MLARRALAAVLAAGALMLVVGLVARASSGATTRAMHAAVMNDGAGPDADGDEHGPSLAVHMVGACVAVLAAVAGLLRRAFGFWRRVPVVPEVATLAVAGDRPGGSSRASPSLYQLCVQLR